MRKHLAFPALGRRMIHFHNGNERLRLPERKSIEPRGEDQETTGSIGAGFAERILRVPCPHQDLCPHAAERAAPLPERAQPDVRQCAEALEESLLIRRQESHRRRVVEHVRRFVRHLVQGPEKSRGHRSLAG